MTALHIAATAICIIAALIFLVSQILIAVWQIHLQIKQNAALQHRLNKQEFESNNTMEHLCKIEEIAEDAKDKADKSSFEIAKIKEMIHDICNHLHTKNKDNER